MAKITVEQFNALSRSEKKILVAKDVLAQLKAEKIYAREGNYFEHYIEKEYEKLPARENLKHIKGCSVCAMGAAMISITKFANQLTLWQLERFDYNKEATDLLATVFTPEEMLIIETAFEGYDKGSSRIGKDMFQVVMEEQILDKADKFYHNNAFPGARLRAIMNNIIKNKGEFIL